MRDRLSAILRRVPRLAGGVAPYGLALLLFVAAPTDAAAQGCGVLYPPPEGTYPYYGSIGSSFVQLYVIGGTPGKTCTYDITGRGFLKITDGHGTINGQVGVNFVSIPFAVAACPNPSLYSQSADLIIAITDWNGVTQYWLFEYEQGGQPGPELPNDRMFEKVRASINRKLAKKKIFLMRTHEDVCMAVRG